MRIRVVFTGRSYHTASSLPDELELSDGASVREALTVINEHLPADAPLPASCLIAVAGQHIGNISGFDDRPLAEGQELTLVAPVAGG